MKTDAEIQKMGYDILASHLEPVEFERFLVMVKRGTFDYTRWRQEQFQNMTVDEISNNAVIYSKQQFLE